MTEIYTPDAWFSIFGGCASLIIDDEGYIYTRAEYNKIIGRCPCGKISYSSGFIYGPDYNALIPTPIAEMKKNYDVTEVYEYGGGLMAAPILYIKNDMIYTPDQYLSLFGGSANGYIKHHKEDNNTSGSYSGGSTGNTSSSSYSGGGSGGGFATVLGLFVFGGLIYILTNEARLANAATVLAIVANVVAAIFFLVRIASGKAHFGWDGKHFLRCLLIGLAVYVCGTAVFVLLGLGSNIGTGHAISDSGGDQLELAAMILAIPFVVDGFILEGGKPKQTYTPPKTPVAPKPPVTKPVTPKPPVTPKTPVTPKPPVTKPITPTPVKSPLTPAHSGTKQCFCIGCRSKLRVPAGVGLIQITCPKCHTSFQLDC